MKVRNFVCERCHSEEGMERVHLFATEGMKLDLYCLEPGQNERTHVESRSDEIYAVLEGEVDVRIGDEERRLVAGEAVLAPAGVEHGLVNRTPARAAVLAYAAPRPG